MVFTTNTKPLVDALALGVINSNVSKFYNKSCILQIAAQGSDLTLNVEAKQIKSEIHLKGFSDIQETQIRLVDNLVFKQLVGTFDTSTVQIEFIEGGISLISGSAKFNLPNIIDVSDVQLNRPDAATTDVVTPVEVDKTSWKFVKDNQMYAIAMSFMKPVYTYVYVDQDGHVIVGDMDNGLFTLSKKSDLGITCLLPDTIVNLFNSLPEGATISNGPNRSYNIHVKTDSFSMLSQFTPFYEDNEEIGSYNADVILGMMAEPDESVSVKTAALSKFLSQASILSTNVDDTIEFKYESGTNKIVLSDSHVNNEVPCDGSAADVKIMFRLDSLRQVINNYSDEQINLTPIINDGDPVGILVCGPSLKTMIAGVES